MSTSVTEYMDNQSRKSYRISKYNPDNRDGSGLYKVDEWTSFSDIGKEFNGVLFTLQEYISMEDKYVSAVLEFCSYFEIKMIQINNLELYSSDIWDKDSVNLKETCEKLKYGKIFFIAEIENLVRLILREYLWCDLEINDKWIHFGYDFYMYFETGAKIPEELKIKIQKTGLYIE
jgi:hypothetical protein